MKILVGCPTSDHKNYCLKDYIKSVKSLSCPNYDILLVDNSKTNDYYEKIKAFGINIIRDKFQEHARDRIISSRNIIRDYVLRNNYDYFLSLEQDVIPPRDVIERLVSHKKEIVSGVVCHNKGGRIRPMVYVQMSKEEFEYVKAHPEQFPRTNEDFKKYGDDSAMVYKQLDLSDVESPKLIPDVKMSSLSCLLISRSVLDKIKFRYDKNLTAFDDWWFFKDALGLGFKAFCDTSVKCKHLIGKHQNWDLIQ